MFLKTSQFSKVLSLNGLKHNGARKMDFNLVVTLPTRRLRVPLEMSSFSNHQCKNTLKLFFLFYSEAAQAVAKAAVMVNTVGPWCPKLGFLAMLKHSRQKDLCPSRFIDCHEQLSETRQKWTLCRLTKTHVCMKLQCCLCWTNDSDAQTVQHDPF